MASSEIALPLRVGARTLWSVRRRLVRRALSLEEALARRVPALPALGPGDDGYLVTSLPADLAPLLVQSASGLRCFVRQRYARRFARLDQTFDEYLAGFSGKSRSTLKRKAKKLAERSAGALDVCGFRTPEEIVIFHKAARALSARTYQERLLDAGLPDGPEAVAEMCERARRDQVRAWLLFVDGRPISYLYAPAEAGTLLYAFLGYDPDFADFSPGTVLQLEAMRQLMAEQKFSLFDFTEGEGQHKRLFATGSIDCVDLLVVRPSAANLLAGHALTAFDGAVASARNILGKSRLRRLLRR